MPILTRAVTRAVASTFASALASAPPDPPIDVARARAQHAAYRTALAALGLDVVLVEADEAHPDCCFVEDTAVVAGGLAMIARSGAPSRQGEGAAVVAALAPSVEIAHMRAPATLDGGDCLRLGRRLYVGRSARTNEEAFAQLVEVFGPRGVRVVPVELPPGVLHLKCLCSPLGEDRLLLARDSLAPEIFDGAGIVWAPAAERYAANAVAFGSGVIVSEGFPRTREALEAAGYVVQAVATTEFRKADGSLTCLSILAPA